MPDDEHIEMIDKNTRRRNGKLEKLDPIYGTWVIHPVQFYKDNKRSMDRMYQEIEEDDEKERKRLYEIDSAKEFMKHVIEYRDLWEDEETPPSYDIEKVIDVTLSGGFSKSSDTEIIFDGKYRDKRARYIAGCSSYSGDFYEPPSEECWLDDIRETITYLEEKVKKHTTPDIKRGWLDPEKKKHGQADSAFSPITKKEHYEHEKRRLEGIYRKDIERLVFLKKFQPTWKYE